ncbi:J domain-containing protein [Hymenobacter sp. GOD-10R]|uniref:J domain-containing protein n=1 Tax=Hymenobacter sp. GOD-10R TaxID=3093922 RepID=UPI002D7895ED|nr:J domain-containing protein [Hymenobacter sp. GOD-10R]WRQ29279.1 J domain-containing protein [Hymenobacter sp. GOD-10R]
MKNHYRTLELSNFASATDVRRAYRRLVLVTHPDRTPDVAAHERYLAINEAYEVLSDAQKRYVYDTRLHAFLNPLPPVVATTPGLAVPPRVSRPPMRVWRRRVVVTTDFSHYAERARRWCRYLLSVPCILFIDYFLLKHTVKAPVVAFYDQYHAITGIRYLIKTTQGSFVTSTTYPESTDTLTVQTSWLFHFVHTAVLPNGKALPVTPDYHSWMAFAGLLTVVALFGQWKLLSPNTSINAAICATMLAIIVVALMINA